MRDKMTIRKNSKGFTLVELLVALVVAAIMFSAGVFALQKIKDGNQDVSEKAELLQNMRFAIGRITSSVRSSSGVDVTSDGTTITLNGVSIGEGTSTVEYGLKTSSLDFSEDRSALPGQQEVYEEIDGGGENPLANYVSDMSFVYKKWDGSSLASLDPATDDLSEASYVEITLSGRTTKDTHTMVSGAEIKLKTF